MSVKTTTSPVLDSISVPIESGAKPVVVIQPRESLFHLDLHAFWQYRELLYFLIWRDVKVRYRQTLIGATWVLLQPLVTMVVFTVVFSNFAKIPSDGLPYPVFAFAALLPWNYFSQATARTGASFVGAANVISKVYFPRLILPLAAALAPLVDFVVAFFILVGMMAWYGIWPTWAVVIVPLLLMLTLLTALATGTWLSTLNVKYRDVGHIIPLLLQLWMFASPVVYPVSLVPERWRPLYSLNPMVGVIEGFRWALLGKGNPNFAVMAVSTLTALVVLLAGIVYFNHVERSFADVV